MHCHNIKMRLGERSYQSSAGAWTRSWPCNFENASHAHGIWPSASTLSWCQIKEIEVQKNSTSKKKKINCWRHLAQSQNLNYKLRPYQFSEVGRILGWPSDSRQPHMPSGLKCEQHEQCCQECNHVAHIQICKRALKAMPWGKKNLAELESEDYRCFLTNEFQRCIICFSSLVTSTKSSSICNISACNNINNKAPHIRVTTCHKLIRATIQGLYVRLGLFPCSTWGLPLWCYLKPFPNETVKEYFKKQWERGNFASTQSNILIFFIKIVQSNFIHVILSLILFKWVKIVPGTPHASGTAWRQVLSSSQWNSTWFYS